MQPALGTAAYLHPDHSVPSAVAITAVRKQFGGQMLPSLSAAFLCSAAVP